MFRLSESSLTMHKIHGAEQIYGGSSFQSFAFPLNLTMIKKLINKIQMTEETIGISRCINEALIFKQKKKQ